MTDIGLISIIPPPAFLFVGLLSVSFVLCLRLRLGTPLVLGHLVALAFMLYGAPAYVEELPRFATAWLHLGFSDAIARTGELFAIRDARFDWPAFFTTAAFFDSAMGVEDFLPLLEWVPPLTMVLYIGPLYLIIRNAAADRRLIWLSIWIFYLVNWVGQDYFSPQGFNVLLYLAILAVVLTWFRREHSSIGPPGGVASGLRRRLATRFSWIAVDPVVNDPAPGVASALSFRQQIGLVAIVVAMYGASVASHQLTPFAVLGGVIGLTVFRRVRLTGLPVYMLVLVGTWLLFMAGTFLSGHLASLLEDIGRLDQNAASNIGARLVGSDGHLLVLQVRLGLSIALWGVALIGGLRRLRAGQLDLSLALLALAPFGLILLQAYGGEMLLRVYLFSVPFMSFFAAAAFYPTPRPASWRLDLLIVGVSVGLAAVMLFTRFGNEKADFVTPEELELVQFAAAVAEPGDTIGSANHSVPLGLFEWEEHRGVSLDEFWRNWRDEPCLPRRIGTEPCRDISRVIQELDERTRDGASGYFVITRGQVAFSEVFWGMSEAEFNERWQDLEERGDLLFRNRDGAVYRVFGPSLTGGQPQ
jgi:hypothetical protein